MRLNKQVKAQLNDRLQMIGQEVDEQFRDIIDDLVVMSENDSELADGLRWIDSQSQKNGMTFYEMALIILRKHIAERKAREWLQSRTPSG
jgi:hypothetical protein